MSTAPSSASPLPEAPAAAPPRSQRPRRRWPRRLAWLLLALLVAALLALIVLWRWAASPGSLEQALAWAQPYMPAALQIEGLQGSVLHGGQAAKVRWSEGGLTVEADEAQARWHLLSLLRGKLRLDELGAARIRVDDARPPSDEAPAAGPPAPLELPLRVEVNAFHAGAVELTQTGLRITGIAGSYHFNQLMHLLRLDSASLMGGRYSASARLRNDASARLNVSLRGEFSLQALQQALPQSAPPAETPAETPAADAPAADASPRLLLRAHLSGPMSDMRLAARLREQHPADKNALDTAQERDIDALGERLLHGDEEAANALPDAPPAPHAQGGAASDAQSEAQNDAQGDAENGPQAPRADLAARITPWAAQPVAQAQARFAWLDLAPFWPAAPQTRLSGQVRIDPADAAQNNADEANANEASAAAWNVQASLTNARPGPWDARRLPLQKLQARLSLPFGPQGLGVRVQQLSADLAGGTLQADGHWLPSETHSEAQTPQTPVASAQPAIENKANDATNASPQPPSGWRVNATLEGIRPAALHTALAAQPLSGHVRASAPAQGGAQTAQTAQTAQADAADTAPAPITFDVDLQAAAADAASAAQPAASAPATPAQEIAQEVARLRLRQLTAQGTWQAGPQGQASAGRLELPTLTLHAADAQLHASGVQVRLADQSGQGQLALTAPGLKLALQGSAAPASGKGQAEVQAASLAQTLQWLQTLPALPASVRQALASTLLTGRANLQGQWQGGWRDPAVKLTLAAPELEWRASAGAAPLKLQGAEARATGRLQDASVFLKGAARQAGRRATLQTQARVRSVPSQSASKTVSGWQAAFSQLDITAQDPDYGPAAWRAALKSPFTLTLENGPAGGQPNAKTEAEKTAPLSVAASAGALALSPASAAQPATLSWDHLKWADARWSAKGKLQNVPLAWAALIPGAELQKSLEPVLDIAGSAILAAEWDAEWAHGQPLRLQAAVERTQGDLILPPLPGAPQRQSAGLQAARVSLNVQGQDATARLLWQTRQIGQAEGQLQTRLAAGDAPWSAPEPWPADAPLQGHLSAKLPRVAAWSLLAPPGWRLRGALDADLRISGTRSAPQWSGQIGADGLALRSVADGFELKNGELRARLQGEQLVIERLTLQGGGKAPGKKAAENQTAQAAQPASALADGGSVTASGQAGWAGGQWSARIDATLNGLRPSIRPDRQIALSGKLQAAMQGSAATLDGQLRVDQAHIELPDDSAPTLDDDVVIHRADGRRESAQDAEAEKKQRQASQREAKTTLAARLGLDLGDAFTLRGQGIDTRLTGRLQATASGPIGTLPRVSGEIRTEGGTFRAYGQQLQISKGVVRFNGAADNPVLDILALRPNYQSDQQAGVRVTGTALLPSVRLYSKPELSDSQTLAWLLLGRAAPSGGAEAAMLQQAALAALSGRDGKSMASRVGLDELSLGEGSGSGSTSLTVGKRLSDKLYTTYEQTLGSAMGTLFIYYELSRRWLVRGQAGEQAALDVIYRISYD